VVDDFVVVESSGEFLLRRVFRHTGRDVSAQLSHNTITIICTAYRRQQGLLCYVVFSASHTYMSMQIISNSISLPEHSKYLLHLFRSRRRPEVLGSERMMSFNLFDAVQIFEGEVLLTSLYLVLHCASSYFSLVHLNSQSRSVESALSAVANAHTM
jgi:hypothetical protein